PRAAAGARRNGCGETHLGIRDQGNLDLLPDAGAPPFRGGVVREVAGEHAGLETRQVGDRRGRAMLVEERRRAIERMRELAGAAAGQALARLLVRAGPDMGFAPSPGCRLAG